MAEHFVPFIFLPSANRNLGQKRQVVAGEVGRRGNVSALRDCYHPDLLPNINGWQFAGCLGKGIKKRPLAGGGQLLNAYVTHLQNMWLPGGYECKDCFNLTL